MGAFGVSERLEGLPPCRQQRQSVGQQLRAGLVLRLPRLVILACLAQSPRYPARAFFWRPNERLQVHGTGSRIEEKWGHTAALRAPAALPRHYLCGILVWSPSWLAFCCNRSLVHRSSELLE